MQILGLSAFNIFNLRLQKLDFIELKSKVKFIKIPPYNANSQFFLEQIQIVLPVLGYTFLKDLPLSKHADTQSPTSSLPMAKSPQFDLSYPKLGVLAHAQEIDGEFVVLQGSTVRHEVINPDNNYMLNLRPQLLEQRIIDPQTHVFLQDYAFKSPSAAAAVILGRSANGRTEWKLHNSQQTYAQWQQQQTDNVQPFVTSASSEIEPVST